MQTVLVLDQGTTGSQAAFFRLPDLEMIGNAKVEFQQIFPQPGWVEHDPEQIWSSTLRAVRLAFEQAQNVGAATKNIFSIGITNQRETIVAWNRKTGQLAGNAIVWQDRRTADFCQKIAAQQKLSKRINELSGLVLDPYFSASKMRWLLDHNSRVKEWAKEGTLCLGTIDAFLIYRLSAGKAFVTEHTNASRTQLYGLQDGDYHNELLDSFGIKREFLPEIKDSAALFASTSGLDLIPDGIPISGCLGDQQAALFGQCCFKAGEAKITYGTGSFILLNIGDKPAAAPQGLLTTVAASQKGGRSFALEGSAFIAGASMQFLRDNFGWFKNASESEALALSEPRDPNLIFIPALAGLGAPYWNAHAKGALLGLSRGSSKAQIIRAVLESVALQNVQLLELMQKGLNIRLSNVGVDGGAALNNYLMQFQSDTLHAVLRRPKNIQTTSLGAAMISLLGNGYQLKEFKPNLDREFYPEMEEAQAQRIVLEWSRAAQAISSFYK